MLETITPAAAPAAATPVAAPAATSTPAVTAPASTTPAASTTPETPAAASAPLSSEDTVAAMVAAAEGKGFGEQKPAEPEIPAVTQPTSVDEKTPEEKAAEAAASSAGQDDDEPYTLDEDGFVGAKDLAAKIEANAALKAALPEDVRNEIMANARLAEFGASMREHFASPEEAKIVAESAQEYAGMIEVFQTINADVNKGTTAFLQKLLEVSALRNADGTPMKNDKGEFITDGTVGKLLDTLTDRKIHNAIISKVKALGDENVQAALDLVMESVGLRPSTADKDQITDPALAARKAELDAQEARIKADGAATKQATWTAYNEAVRGELNNVATKAIESILDSATALDAFTRTAVEAKLESALKAAIKSNPAYQIDRKKIEAMGPTAERSQKEIALAKRFLRDNLGRISRPIMLEAGIAVGKKVGERAAAQAARTENVRSEISGGAPTSVQPTGAQNATQQRDAVAAALKTQTGRDPSESEISVALMMAAARAKGFAA